MQVQSVKIYPKTAAHGVALKYGFCETPYGPALLGRMGEDLCWLALLEDMSEGEGLQGMKAFFPKAIFAQEAVALRHQENLALYGTDFQLAVWAALLQIPAGQTVTYGALAAQIGKPEAARAVGGAVGANPVAVFVPCHRVLASSGVLGGYAWGLALKQRILAGEGIP